MSTSILPPSVKLLLAKGKATTDVNGRAEVIIEVPANGRSITGGDGCFSGQLPDDYLTIELRDDDDILGGGAGALVNAFHDLDEPTVNQGWFFLGGLLQLDPLIDGETTDLPGGLYLHIFGHKAVVPQTPETLYINLRWGKRYR